MCNAARVKRLRGAAMEDCIYGVLEPKQISSHLLLYGWEAEAQSPEAIIPQPCQLLKESPHFSPGLLSLSSPPRAMFSQTRVQQRNLLKVREPRLLPGNHRIFTSPRAAQLFTSIWRGTHVLQLQRTGHKSVTPTPSFYRWGTGPEKTAKPLSCQVAELIPKGRLNTLPELQADKLTSPKAWN